MPDSPPRSRFPRFSLRTFILVCLLVSTLVALGVVSNRFQKANEEVGKLRDELGYITVVDEEKIHAVAIPTGDDMYWRWRLYLPGRVQYRIQIASWVGIPKEGLPNSDSMFLPLCQDVESQEIIFSIRFYRNEKGKWFIRITQQNEEDYHALYVDEDYDELYDDGYHHALDHDQIDAYMNASGKATMQWGSGGVVTGSTSAPFFLFRCYVYDWSDDTDPPGFMIWLEPKEL